MSQLAAQHLPKHRSTRSIGRTQQTCSNFNLAIIHGSPLFQYGKSTLPKLRTKKWVVSESCGLPSRAPREAFFLGVTSTAACVFLRHLVCTAGCRQGARRSPRASLQPAHSCTSQSLTGHEEPRHLHPKDNTTPLSPASTSDQQLVLKEQSLPYNLYASKLRTSPASRRCPAANVVMVPPGLPRCQGKLPWYIPGIHVTED